ncbi:hypothetical protein TWF694_011885 [Orbilia ellipsospora]|uniref:Uncharacterized protein n=1 Tax=Orbilia ellipsospora TaxID=2528407 RepID=A0AAV9X7S5_9PEZI
MCEMERENILNKGMAYGSEDTLQIEDFIIQAVKSKQSIVEWQIYMEDGTMRKSRHEKLQPVDEAWKKYLLNCKELRMPPRLSYPEASSCDLDEQVKAASILMELRYS